jgi:hypothetical protein
MTTVKAGLGLMAPADRAAVLRDSFLLKLCRLAHLREIIAGIYEPAGNKKPAQGPVFWAFSTA